MPNIVGIHVPLPRDHPTFARGTGTRPIQPVCCIAITSERTSGPPGMYSHRAMRALHAAVRLNRDRRFDAGVGLVVGEFEVFVLEAEEVLHGGIELHARRGVGRAGKLGMSLLDVI